MSNNQPQEGSGAAWRTLEETGAGMSPKKLSSERKRRDIGLVLGPVLFLLLLLIPMGEGLTFKTNLCLGITAWIMVWWVCESVPMPVTSLFGAVLFMVFQVLPAQTAMNQLGNSNTWFLIGQFVFMNALVKHGFTLRVAYWLLSLRIGRKSPYYLLALYIFATGFISSWLANMATTMLFLAISSGMIQALQLGEDHKMTQAMRIGTAFSAQAGGLGTPMGAAGTNFIIIGLIVTLTGYDFSVASWMKAGIPFALVMIFVVIFYFRVVFKIDLPNYQKACDYAQEQRKAMGKMKRGEKQALFIALVCIILWLIPDFFQAFLGAQAQIVVSLKTILNTANVSLFGATLCFLIPVDRKENKFVMNWTEANRYIDWGALLLVVCGLIMGAAMQAEDVGILKAVADWTSSVLGSVPSFVGVLGLVVISIVITQFIANLPSIAIIVPLGYAVAIAIGLNPVAMMFTMGVGCQMSFMLPVSAPQMAFVYGTGSVSIKEFIKYGGGMAVISVVFTTLFYYFAALLFPF